MKRSLFFHAVTTDQVNSLKEHSYALLTQLEYWTATYSESGGKLDWSKSTKRLIDLVRANILARDQLNEILQEQVTSLMKDPLTRTPSETIVLPGQILQNETRINWEALRNQYEIVLDKPVGYYQQYVYDQLKQAVADFYDPEMTYTEALNFDPGPGYPLDQLEYLDRKLTRKGLCRSFDQTQLLTKFSWVYFCGLSIYSIPISNSLRNSLQKHKIQTIGDVIPFSREKLMSIPMFGNARIEELLRLLYAMGLSLDMKAIDFRKLYGV